MALPVVPLIILGLVGAGVAFSAQPKKRGSSSPRPPSGLPQGYDPNAPKALFRLDDGTPRFANDTIDMDAWQQGDVVTFMAGQIVEPNLNDARLGRLQRPSAAEDKSLAGGWLGTVQDYRLVDIATELAGFSTGEYMEIPVYWRFARIGENPLAPYSWTFYQSPTQEVLPDEINFSRGFGPSQAAVKVTRDGNVIWRSGEQTPQGDKIV